MSILQKLSCVISLALFISCGGGGGGSTQVTPPPLGMSLSTHAITTSSYAQDPYLVTATVNLTISGAIPSGGIYVGGNFTSNGIDSISALAASNNTVVITINYKSASTLAVGTYSDTISVIAATDQAGTNQIANSPQTINSTYKVLLPPPQITMLSPASAYVGGPAFTLTIMGSGFPPDAQIQWNGIPMPTIYVSATTLTAAIPATALAAVGTAQITVSGADLATSNPIPFTIGNSQATFINIPASDLVWDGLNQVIYAAVPNILQYGSNNIFPNTIAAIDPNSGQVIKTVSTGGGINPPVTGPFFLAISEDSSFLYAFTYVNQPGVFCALQRYILPALTLDATFNIPFSTNTVSAMSVAPGAPHTLAIAMAAPGGRNAGVMIFDDTMQRGSSVLASIDGLPFSYLQWSPDASTLYVAEDWPSLGEYLTLSVNSGGPSVQSDAAGVLSSGSHDIHYVSSTGKIYVGNGQVLDPSTHNTVGTCGTGWGGMAPDPILGLGFFLDLHPSLPSGTSGLAIHSYDLTRYSSFSTTSIPLISVPNTPGFLPNRIIRCGPSTLALGGGLGPICLIKGPFAQGK
ncbi:hypothetical protein [Geothrix oryzisoli]|uniref:hypothetical protein n=1 Tax=Geothrix oryzisoli TaxID=2922721 RepID=UPI001FAD76FC|nr:hypothetical protein [Geothrix oryzisoli]